MARATRPSRSRSIPSSTSSAIWWACSTRSRSSRPSSSAMTGAPAAWHSALMRPDRLRRRRLERPYRPRGRISAIDAFKMTGMDRIYMMYLEEVGVAEREFEADVARSLRQVYRSASGSMPEGQRWHPFVPPGKGCSTPPSTRRRPCRGSATPSLRNTPRTSPPAASAAAPTGIATLMTPLQSDKAVNIGKSRLFE